MDRRPANNLEQENARLGLIDKIVERAVNRPNVADKDAYYAKQLPKVGKFTLDEVLEHVLRVNGHQPSPSSSGLGIGLRSLDNVDLDSLLRGFEPEESAEQGKLVLYITEKQLLQLLKQRAVMVPSLAGASADSFDGNRRTKEPVLFFPSFYFYHFSHYD